MRDETKKANTKKIGVFMITLSQVSYGVPYIRSLSFEDRASLGKNLTPRKGTESKVKSFSPSIIHLPLRASLNLNLQSFPCRVWVICQKL